MDIFSMLLRNRTIFLNGQVTDQAVSSLIAQIFYLNYENDTKPIHFYINSQGGSVLAGLGLYDCILASKSPIYTYGVSLCASMGSFLLMSGEPNHRYALPNSTIMIHQIAQHGGGGGKLNDMEINLEEMRRLNDLLTQKYVKHCGFKGKDYNYFKETMRHDYWMTPEQALEIGLIDQITPALR
jgi:ATP-dependent Clp protease protease subunit